MDIKKDDSGSLPKSSHRRINTAHPFLLNCLLYRVQFIEGQFLFFSLQEFKFPFFQHQG